MAPQTPQQVEHGTESSRTTGASANTPLTETQLQRRHDLAHRDAANAATENTTLDAHLTFVRKAGCSKNLQQHTIGCEYSRFVVDDCQPMILRAVGVRRELPDQFLAASKGKPPWLTTASVRTVCENEHHEAVSSEISVEKFSDKNP